METIRFFQDSKLSACVSTVENPSQYLGVGEDGILTNVPDDVTGFHLAVGVLKHFRTFVSQKDVGQELGGYSTEALAKLGGSKGLDWTIMSKPIQVQRVGPNVWTVWHTSTPNRMDCWSLTKDGLFSLYQIGVVTHDDGRTWRLHGEYRWKGKLFARAGVPVACPDEPRVKWGPFQTWEGIFESPSFRRLLESATLANWTGKSQDLDPPLPQTNNGLAILQWYIPFAGQEGQGYVWLRNGKEAAVVLGDDVSIAPDADGVKRLWRGDVISYEDKVFGWGAKKNGPPKLTGVKLESRSW
jgi:hypothetical protein